MDASRRNNSCRNFSTSLCNDFFSLFSRKYLVSKCNNRNSNSRLIASSVSSASSWMSVILS